MKQCALYIPFFASLVFTTLRVFLLCSLLKIALRIEWKSSFLPNLKIKVKMYNSVFMIHLLESKHVNVVYITIRSGHSLRCSKDHVDGLWL